MHHPFYYQLRVDLLYSEFGDADFRLNNHFKICLRTEIPIKIAKQTIFILPPEEEK
jgi:hypothetical protein